MNKREKILAGAVLGMGLLLGVGVGGHALLVRPLEKVDKQSGVLRDKLRQIAAERRAYFAAEDKLKAVTLETFADDADEASAKSGELLTQLLLASGLSEAAFTRLPVGPRKIGGASEIGWSVQGEGALTNVINLLFLLENSPQLRRLDGVTISTSDRPGRVKVHFRYLTLVVTPAPTVTRTELKWAVALNGPERASYQAIAERDLLRPYIKRPPPKPPTVKPTPAPAPPPTVPAVPGPELRIVSLSEWDGRPEIHVRDVQKDEVKVYRPGDALCGGQIVMVDYRALPMPGQAELMSFSRVIIRIGADYWAVERGQSLADRRVLPKEDWPAELPKS